MFRCPLSAVLLPRCAILFIACLLYTCSVYSQTNFALQGNRAYILVKALEKYHYEPLELNDTLSAMMMTDFLETLDPHGMYFTVDDIEVLNKWNSKLDDEINNRSTAFLEKATELYQKKLKTADSVIEKILSQACAFSLSDSITFGKREGSLSYAKSEKDFSNRWRKWLKYQVLTTMFAPADENDKPFSKDVKVLLQKEPEARAKVLNKNRHSVKRILDAPEGFENYVASIYLNSLVKCYDPHSSFLSASGKRSFESGVSAEGFSFGIDFDETENGEIEVAQIVPGGSAWKSNQLHKGDVILQIIPEGSKSIDLTYSTPDEAAGIIESLPGNQADFIIRKANGQISTLTLVKSKLRTDENIVKGYILNGKNKIGYLSLPSFYDDWENKNASGCANDVAKEIVKLQEENIDGLILDLRYNGGGSVKEAIGLSGLFIDEGPLSIYKIRDEKPLLIKDMNRGTAYNGPLMVMINGLSASATELFSGAIQDYHRGMIIGSPSYGKATGQIIFSLDTLKEAKIFTTKDGEDLGFIKATIEKFYRVTNVTHQKRGIQPDITIPEPYYLADYRETSYPTALSADSVVKKVVYNALPALPLKELSEKSAERMKVDKNFIRLRQLNNSLSFIRNHTTRISLNPQSFNKAEKESYRLIEELADILADSSDAFIAVNHNYDQKVISIDTYSKEMNDILLKNIQSDIYIEEAYYIMTDFLTSAKK
jgi:carboxyl-terminal processing protease